MLTLSRYLERAAEFEALAARTTDGDLQKRYADIAACYRLLIREREHMIAAGSVVQDSPDQMGTGNSPPC